VSDESVVVPGRGRVSVEPDLASVRLGVSVTRPTASEARESAATTMAAILAAISGGGVDRKDIRTALVSLSPVVDYSSERGPRVTGYQLTNTAEVTVRSLPTVGAVIDAGLAAGATSLDGLDFRLADPVPAETRARQAAFVDARRRAETLAGAAGRTLGPVVAIAEGQGPPVGPFPRGPIAAMAMKAEADTPVEAGSQDVVVSIVVTFALD
jgi:uncharacterized protein YggE